MTPVSLGINRSNVVYKNYPIQLLPDTVTHISRGSLGNRNIYELVAGGEMSSALALT